MVFLGWRRERTRSLRERQWQDAEVIGDVRLLLHDIDPIRCGLNVNPAPGVEDAQWASLNQRRDQVRRRLLALAAGHASAAVRSSADRLEPQLFKAAVQAEWHVADVIKRRANPEHLGYAQECYDSAVAACAELESAIKAAAQGNRLDAGTHSEPGVVVRTGAGAEVLSEDATVVPAGGDPEAVTGHVRRCLGLDRRRCLIMAARPCTGGRGDRSAALVKNHPPDLINVALERPTAASNSGIAASLWLFRGRSALDEGPRRPRGHRILRGRRAP